MEALKLFEEKERMCKCYKLEVTTVLNKCMSECPLANYTDCNLEANYANRYDKKEILMGKIEKIEKWSKENPRKTYKMDFLEKFPKAKLKTNVCRDNIYDTNCKSCCDKTCEDCWNTEMETNQNEDKNK
jgi:hypothetical protein